MRGEAQALTVRWRRRQLAFRARRAPRAELASAALASLCSRLLRLLPRWLPARRAAVKSEKHRAMRRRCARTCSALSRFAIDGGGLLAAPVDVPAAGRSCHARRSCAGQVPCKRRRHGGCSVDCEAATLTGATSVASVHSICNICCGRGELGCAAAQERRQRQKRKQMLKKQQLLQQSEIRSRFTKRM